jgi:hypothetical protein
MAQKGERAAEMQCAADDLNTIIDTVSELRNLLDRYYENHDRDITRFIDEAWPRHDAINHALLKSLGLALDLISPEE